MGWGGGAGVDWWGCASRGGGGRRWEGGAALIGRGSCSWSWCVLMLACSLSNDIVSKQCSSILKNGATQSDIV